jgi:hypothetical protein
MPACPLANLKKKRLWSGVLVDPSVNNSLLASLSKVERGRDKALVRIILILISITISGMTVPKEYLNCTI